MHGIRRESLGQLFCGFIIQLRFSSWPLFGSITGHSRSTCLRGLYVSSGFSRVCSLMLDSGLVSFEIKSTIK